MEGEYKNWVCHQKKKKNLQSLTCPYFVTIICNLCDKEILTYCKLFIHFPEDTVISCCQTQVVDSEGLQIYFR